ncbi:rRNA-processing protein and EBNA1-binding protein ebp2 [Neopestalotiopsis sp. 37M]|nr:rRNA-processing protein and EBNA1-binding protein ebp2 [Neopestalotiopsis sp. 37M]
MVNKGKLKMALAAEKGVDFQKLHQKKVAKAAAKKKGPEPESDDHDEEEEDDDESGSEDEDDEVGHSMPLNDESDSDSEVEMEEKIERKPKPVLKFLNAKPSKPGVPKNDDEDEEDDEEEDEEDIPMSDLEDLPENEKEDLIPHTRLTINNTSALLASVKRIAIPTDKSVPFATHQCVTSTEATADDIEDVQDDLKRELAFYKQSLEAAKLARSLLKAENVPFSRPNDYFAEMVKDDGHMEKVKAKLLEEASAKKASAEARKLRDLKKFGKQVQNAKLQERQKAKRDTLEKIKSLKRKRQEGGGDVGANEADLFDVGVDNELKQHDSREKRGAREGGPNMKRQKKDQKYGFGGKKKHSKSGDAISTGDMSGFSAKRMKTGTKGKPMKTARLGKARRNAGAQKR